MFVLFDSFSLLFYFDLGLPMDLLFGLIFDCVFGFDIDFVFCSYYEFCSDI